MFTVDVAVPYAPLRGYLAHVQAGEQVSVTESRGRLGDESSAEGTGGSWHE
jgi:hypothetical protein